MMTKIELDVMQPSPKICGWWVGPIWKLDGETCVCHLEQGHDGPHECTCGASFEGCGHPPEGDPA